MLCQNCKRRTATQNHMAIINNKSFEYHLCAQCANEMFGGFENSYAKGASAGLFEEQPQVEKVCPLCGMTLAEFKETFLLGCPSCYDVFREELLPYIEKTQKKTRHVGKPGGENTAEHDIRIELAHLQKSMEKALASGNYVEAEKINRQMNAIKKKGHIY